MSKYVTAAELRARLQHDPLFLAPLTDAAFKALVARILRRDGAARAIQAHWRNAIADPEFHALV